MVTYNIMIAEFQVPDQLNPGNQQVKKTGPVLIAKIFQIENGFDNFSFNLYSM